MLLQWYYQAWMDYCAWQREDKKTLRRINTLIKDILRHPCEGIGKPEPLKGNLSGWWSRRIDTANRIIYRQADNVIIIAACKNHYD